MWPKTTDQRGRPQVYTPDVKAALLQVWEVCGQICPKRLASFPPEIVAVLKREGELKVPPETKRLLVRTFADWNDARPRISRDGPGGPLWRERRWRVLHTLSAVDVATGTLLRTLRGHTWVVFSMAFSPDGKVLASGSYDNTIKLWDVEAALGKR
jgi:hypothetical protein